MAYLAKNIFTSVANGQNFSNIYKTQGVDTLNFIIGLVIGLFAGSTMGFICFALVTAGGRRNAE